MRRTKGDDFYLTLTESTKKFNGEGFERHKIFLYKEDFNRFLEHLQEAIDHVKEHLMPDYDYDEFTRRHEEYEEMYGENGDEREDDDRPRERRSPARDNDDRPPRRPEGGNRFDAGNEDDISW